MNQEIERKWLVKSLHQIKPISAHNILQGYIINNKNESVRIRQTSDQHCLRDFEYFLTIKSGSGIVRNETEINLTSDQFDSLFPLTKGSRIYKNRSLVELDNHLIAEVDIFSDQNGLVMVEVEFPSLESAEAFIAPDWFGEDVTHDEKYINARLAK